jgi:hypothetical protein
MTRAVLLSYLGVGLLGGVVGGGAVRLTAPSPKAVRPIASAEPESTGESSDTETRIAQLERSVATLERERKLLKLAAAYGSAVGAAADGGAPPSSVVDDPVFQAAVRDVMDQVETEKRDERKTEREERRRKMADRFSDGLATTLGLSDAQKQKVAAAVQAYFEDMRALRDSENPPQSPSEWRQKMDELQKKRESELTQALTPEQKQKYDALDAEDKLGAGFGRRRGGRGRGAGGDDQ